MKGTVRSAMLVASGILAVAVMARPTMAEGPAASSGWTLHIDAKLHFPGKPDMIAHHFCKAVRGGITECHLYDSDEANARLVGVEVIVGPEVYGQFTAEEKAMWHYHKVEIPKVSATLPDLSPEEGAKVVKGIEETYGKIYLLWDPAHGDLPTGHPTVTVLGLH